jgi:hypothetical protein
MVDLNDYLKLNSNAIIDLVERKYVPAEMSQESTFEGLATLLQGKIYSSARQQGGKTRSGPQCSCNGHNIFNVAFPSKSK